MLLSRASPARRTGVKPSFVTPAELVPQILRDELVYPIQGVIRQVFLRLLLEVLGGSLAGQDDGGGHACVFRHADLRVEPVARRHALLGVEFDQVHYRLEHYGVGLADVDLALRPSTSLYGPYYGGCVGLAPSAWKRAVTVRVRGY